MKKQHNQSIIAAAIIGSALLIASCANRNQKSTEEKNINPVAIAEDPVAQGKYLVTIMGCNDCHSPKKMGANGPEIIPELMLSGFPSNRPIVKFDTKLIKQGFSMFYPDLTATAGPWGISFTGNLTPDSTGIGSWTEAQFKTAITEGKFKGLKNGRMLLPPMPWPNFVNLKNEEVHAIFMYLKSIQPVKNVVPAPIGPDKM